SLHRSPVPTTIALFPCTTLFRSALGWRRHLLLHASTVEKDGKALLMTGLSGSGKSTLSAMLAEKGWRFMGDEFALLNSDTLMVQDRKSTRLNSSHVKTSYAVFCL